MRTLRAAVLVLACVAAPIAATGCVHKPTMTLRGAEIRGVQLGWPLQAQVQMTVLLDVYNPNSYDVAVRAVRGETLLADRFTVPVHYQAPGDGVWMAADRTTRVAVPIAVPVDVGLVVLAAAASAPTVPYRFRGRADVTGTRTFAIEKDDYAVDERGEIPREQFEAALRTLPIPGFPHL